MEENNSEQFSDSEVDFESWNEEFDDQSDDGLDNKRRKRTCLNSSINNVVKKQNVQGTLNDKMNQERDDGFWEDIYGRTRDKEGNVVQANVGKYIPPHLRLGPDSDKRSKELSRLHKQLKGLINRLAENNMHSISSQIDELYMKNSRNDMNETLTTLIFESLILPTLSSERLVAEHVMLMAILHANIGMEVGAHFLQTTVKKFDELFNENCTVQDKGLDNTVLILSHLYNFKVFNAILMYNILDKLSEKFTEKEVELILLILKNVGLSLRKDDPAALKNLILRLQKKANESIELRNNTRVRFMLDILLAVKNNNMAKIPQYDPSYSEHLKKLIKTMIHKGKYLTELKITLDDLLKVEERGRWWIVGSAWTGNTNLPQDKEISNKSDQFSSRILELASKQRMNTDTRRNVFCILMTAEDYMDAFEKLLRLGLKAGQEQEIIHVLIHCLLHEKVFNPYYAHLANQFCTTDRKYQLTIQYNMWDRFKELSDLSTSQITNMAKFLAHLFLEKSLPISVLKVIQFADMDKQCVKLMRQLLLALLFHHCEETMMAVFSRVSKPTKLKMFRESILLFLHHFVLRNVKDNSDEAIKLRERVKLAETALTSVDTKKIL
uniref:MI domain-containing protein n=1 Tax=Clastoptera arizonana TaxID=38151 RepID=A0A1B6CQN6_9HEMI